MATVGNFSSRLQRTVLEALLTNENLGQFRMGVHSAVVDTSPGIVDVQIPNCNFHLRAWHQ